jgi:hypothetical protein
MVLNHRRLNRCGYITLLGLNLALLPLGIVHAQTPLGDDLVLAAFPPNVQAENSPQPACDDAGVCGLFWGDLRGLPDNKIDVLAAVLSPQGQALVPSRVLATGRSPNNPIAVGLEQGFAVLWDYQFPDGHVSPVLQYYDESLVPQGERITLPFVQAIGGSRDPATYTTFSQILRTPSGFALYGTAIETPYLYNAFVFRVDRNGRQIAARQRLDTPSLSKSVGVGFNGLAAQPNGDFVGVYWRFGDNEEIGDAYVRRLAANGQRLGSEQRINPERNTNQGPPAVATAPDGSFLVVWRSTLVAGTSDILARRFSAQGQPLGKQFRVNNVHQIDQGWPVIASDAQGNYLIAWQSFTPPYHWDIKGRLFRHDGTPVADEVRLNQVRQLWQFLPQVAFSPTGTVIAGWNSASVRQKGSEQFVPVARVFSLVPKQ